MLCPNCGTILPDGSNFCTECGASLKDAQSSAPVYADEPVSFSVPGVPPVIDPVAPFTGLDLGSSAEPEEPAPRSDDSASDDPFAAFNAAAAASGLVKETPPPYTAPSFEPYEPKLPKAASSGSAYSGYSAPSVGSDASAEPAAEVPASEGYSAPVSGGYSVPGGGYSAPLPASRAADGKRKRSGGLRAVVILVAVIALIIAAAALFMARRSSPAPKPQAAIVQSENSGSLTDHFRRSDETGSEPDSDSDSPLSNAFRAGGSK